MLETVRLTAAHCSGGTNCCVSLSPQQRWRSVESNSHSPVCLCLCLCVSLGCAIFCFLPLQHGAAVARAASVSRLSFCSTRHRPSYDLAAPWCPLSPCCELYSAPGETHTHTHTCIAILLINSAAGSGSTEGINWACPITWSVPLGKIIGFAALWRITHVGKVG